MRLTTATPMRPVLAALALAATVALAGCAEDPATPAGLSTTTASPAPTATPTADEEAAVREVFDRFWAAMAEAERGNPDPALFADSATGAIVEEEMALAAQYQRDGIVREGAPTFKDVTVEIDGGTATVWSCLGNATWRVPGVDYGDTPDFLPNGTVLDTSTGDWRVTGLVPGREGMAC